MKANEISAKLLNADAQSWIEQLGQVLLIQDKGKGTVKNYTAEMILLFKYYNSKTVDAITETEIEQYIVYIKTVHQVGRAKCRSVASACSFFYKQVIKMPYVLPSALYPQKQFIPPNIMSQQEVAALFAAALNLKEYCVIGLLYGSGLRISEVAALRIQDIESASKRIKVVQGKGAKDQYTLLAGNLLDKLRQYYVSAKRPKQYLFTSAQTGKAFHPRSMQLEVTGAMKKAGFAQKGYTSHTLRHSFATHMLDNGSNIHVIKTLLGHSKLETTMVYLHLQQHTQFGIMSPWINYWEVAMQQQTFSEIQQLLQQKIFGHPCVGNFNPYSRAVLKRLHLCHTAGIGVHHLRCNKPGCNNEHYQYHCCVNRHCPNCGGIKKEQWLQDRMSELLPTTYYHLVFTLPQELRSLVMGNRTTLFNLLFDATHHTINLLSADKKWLGARPGIVSILHTNGQDLSFHPHIHCIVSGGGILPSAVGEQSGVRWVKEKRINGNYLFPKSKMEKEYKTCFLKKLRHLLEQQKIATTDATALQTTIEQLSKIRWNVHANAPFGGPAQILEYLGRYTHKTAITAHRIKQITHTTISFTYKDYADGKKQKLMTLSHEEFLRRFEQHILPARFVRIRHGGYLAHNGKNHRIAAILLQLKLPKPMPKVIIPFSLQMLQRTGIDYSICPKCKEGKMEITASYLNHNGSLINIKDLTRRRTKNKASPPIPKAT